MPRSIGFVPKKDLITRNIHVKYQSSSTYYLKEKKVKSQGQQKDFITRNIYMKCKNSSTHCSKVFGKVKVFKL